MELPRLQPLFDTYKGRGFEIVAVEAMGDTEKATKFIEDQGLTYTFLEDNDEAKVSRSLYGVGAFPSSFLIDREGRIQFFHLGFEPGDEEHIAEEIESLL